MKFKMIIDQTKDEEIVATVHSPSGLTEKIQQLVQEYTGTDRVAAYVEDDVQMLPFAEIACITVIDGKTFAVDSRGRQYRLKQRLYELEELLARHKFARISHSEIVNLSHVTALDLSLSGTIRMTLTGGVTCFVSRRCLKKIKQALDL
jgi:DNA-binding LytR/AlgR family response regulator